MVKRYQDLDQRTLFPMLSLDWRGKNEREGAYRVLSGEAAERAALRILKRRVDAIAERHRHAVGAVVPDLYFRYRGNVVYGEVKSLNRYTGDGERRAAPYAMRANLVIGINLGTQCTTFEMLAAQCGDDAQIVKEDVTLIGRIARVELLSDSKMRLRLEQLRVVERRR